MAMTQAQTRKAEVVEELRARLVESRVVGLASVASIPAPQMQRIRAGLRGTAEMRVVKNRLLLRSLEAAAAEKASLRELKDLVEGQVALVLTEANPFQLFRVLEGTKTAAPARGGELAPEDIVVEEGDTPFKPGPVVGDLQKVGIPAAIERGKVVIKKDKVLVQKGEPIPREVARALTRLEIFPLIVGLDLRGVLEGDHLFTRDVLDVDAGALRGDVQAAAARAFQLALALAYPSADTLPLLLGGAQLKAEALAVALRYPAKSVLPHLLTKAQGRMLALASRVPEGLDAELQAAVGVSASPTPAPSSEGEEKMPSEPPAEAEKKEDDEDEEEEAAAGLSSLFG